jgi:prepilin-type N-terminal cleavage/methylation domain-containing protein/prepilin-type processing-associated H-X9-DG protein
MQNPLSSNLAFAARFSLSLPAQAQYDALLPIKSMTNSSPPRVARAFTLIELLIVIAIIAILAGIAIPALTSALERAKVTKDMSNLRQIGTATQMYMNDNNGVFPGSATLNWMSQLEQNQKYLSTWRVLESPFDKRSTSELGDGTTAISYGINSNLYVGNVAISADKITKPTAFIVFAPAQAAGATVTFAGWANSTAPGVTVLGAGGNAATSTPGGNATRGPHNNRSKINALFGDLHSETMAWATFTNNAATGGDPDGELRWKPYTPYP